MKSIIITGGAGFIGSHVVRLFVNKYPEYRIINVDKLTYAGNLANLKDIEEFSGISCTISEDRLSFLHLYLTMLEDFISGDCAVKKALQIIDSKRLEHKDLTAGQKGSNDLKGRILSRSTDQNDRAIFNCTKDAVYVGYYRVGDIFSKGNVQPYNLNTYFVDMMTAKNGQTPEEFNNVFLKEYSDDRWSTYLNRLFE